MPPTEGDLDSFMARFTEAYGNPNMPKVQATMAVAAAHRFLWIHPFYDANGRVARFLYFPSGSL